MEGKIPKSDAMKKVVLGLLGLMLAGALHSCTNDEGDTEFDTLTPNVEQQQAA